VFLCVRYVTSVCIAITKKARRLKINSYRAAMQPRCSLCEITKVSRLKASVRSIDIQIILESPLGNSRSMTNVVIRCARSRLVLLAMKEIIFRQTL